MDFTSFKNQFENVPVVENDNLVTNKPLVSICVQTYQHVDFISECLDSILKQQTDFPFEIILGEDESTDGTGLICEGYANKFSDKIRFFSHKRKNNILIKGKPSGRFNMMYNLYSSNGKYIALCEGDDYWTDPLKLQKQVDFLEDNEDYGICFHESAIEWDNNHVNSNIELNSQFPWNKMNASQSTYTIGDVFNGPFMATASVVYRNNFVKEFPSWFHEAASGDITLFALIIGDKKIKFINEIMSVYRRHDGGITRFHKGSSIIINRIVTLKSINSFYKGVYKIEIQKSVSNYLNSITLVSFKDLLILYKVFMTSNIVKKNLLGILTCYVLKNQLKKFV